MGLVEDCFGGPETSGFQSINLSKLYYLMAFQLIHRPILSLRLLRLLRFLLTPNSNHRPKISPFPIRPKPPQHNNLVPPPHIGQTMRIKLKLPKITNRILINIRIDDFPHIELQTVTFDVGGDTPLAETLAQAADFVDMGVFPV